MAITRDQVLEAAGAIAADGGEPTYMNVRARLGTGSFSTIQKYLRDWRTTGQVETGPSVTTLPEAFTEALNRFGSEAWKAASQWAKDEIEAARRAYEEKAKEHDAEMERAAGTVDALQETLKATTEERDTLKREAEELKANLARAEATLAEVRRQSEAKLNEEQAQLEALRAESKARHDQDEQRIREGERQTTAVETRLKEMEREGERLKGQLDRERAARETGQTELTKVRAELDQERKRVAELQSEREEDRKESRTYLAKIEEWVRRATEAETRLAVTAPAPDRGSGT